MPFDTTRPNLFLDNHVHLLAIYLFLEFALLSGCELSILLKRNCFLNVLACSFKPRLIFCILAFDLGISWFCFFVDRCNAFRPLQSRCFAEGRHVFACIRGVTYERSRFKRRNLSKVAECDAEEWRQLRNWLPNVSRSCGKVAVILQNMLKSCRIVGDRMLNCYGVESRSI